VLGIVERILAALIILALLTLLIILAFPVPPRQPVGAPPSNETQRADKPPEPAPPAPAPAPAPAPGSTSAPKQPPAKAPEPPVVKKSAERLPETKVLPPPPPVVVEKTPQPSVLAKSDRERIVDSRVEVYPPKRIVAVRRDPLVVKRERVRHGPVLVDDCGRDCFDDCCCDTRDRPYWAKPKRRVAVAERGDPDWADSPRRRRWAGIPPGVCPE
jgi:hypothetical protein